MTTFCDKCQSNDHTSLMILFNGQNLCRKCQVFDDKIGGIWDCRCGVWELPDLRQKISEDGMQPECDECNEKITRFGDHPDESRKAIDHPSHYQSEKFEVIDIIEEFSLNFNLGNVIKYILRAGKKENLKQDLEKARWYLSREIDNLP